MWVPAEDELEDARRDCDAEAADEAGSRRRMREELLVGVANRYVGGEDLRVTEDQLEGAPAVRLAEPTFEFRRVGGGFLRPAIRCFTSLVAYS